MEGFSGKMLNLSPNSPKSDIGFNAFCLKFPIDKKYDLLYNKIAADAATLSRVAEEQVL